MVGKKLLVADDSLTIQKVIRLALSNEGYEIQTVSDGTDAIQQISLFRPDVVLIDVSLPIKSAIEVKRTFADSGDLSRTRFILMSSAFEKVDETQVEGQFHGRLTKPFDPAHLRQVLSEVLAQPENPVRAHSAGFDLPPPLPQTGGAPLPPKSNPPGMPGLPGKPPHPPHSSHQAPPSTGSPKSKPTLGGSSGKPPASPAQNSNEIDLPPSIPTSPREMAFTHEPMAPEVDDPIEVNDLWHDDPSVEDSAVIQTPPAPIPPPTGSLDSFGASESEENDFQIDLHDSAGGPRGIEIVRNDGITAPSAPPNELSPSEPEDSGPEQDIRELTASTIRMSGLDDFQWSVNENAKKAASTLQKDEPQGKFSGNMPAFSFDEPLSESQKAEPITLDDDDLSRVRSQEPALPPSPSMLDLGGVNFNFDEPPAPPSHPSESSQSHSLPEDFDEIVERKVEEKLQEMARKLLPDLAERLLKQEIRKMLQEP